MQENQSEEGMVFSLRLDNLLVASGEVTPKGVVTGILRDILLLGKVMVSDVWALTNTALREFLGTEFGRKLLQGGFFRIALRDNVSSFTELLASLRKANTHGLTGEGLDEYAQHLDGLKLGNIRFPLKELGVSFTSLSELVMKPESLLRFGLAEAAAERAMEVFFAEPDPKRRFTRSFFVDGVQPTLPVSDGNLLMDMVNVIYGLGLPTAKSCGLSVPAGKADMMDRVLSSIYGGEKYPAGTIGMSSDAELNFPFSAKVVDPIVSWLLSNIADFGWVEFEIAISGHAREEYLTAARQQLVKPSKENWENFIRLLEYYLKTVGIEVFNYWAQSVMLTDPKDEETKVDGGMTIRVATLTETAYFGGIRDTNLRVVGEVFGRPKTIIA